MTKPRQSKPIARAQSSHSTFFAPRPRFAATRCAAPSAARAHCTSSSGSSSSRSGTCQKERSISRPPALAHYQRSALVRFPDLLLLRVCEAYDRLGQARAAEPVVGEYLAAFHNSRLATRLAARQVELGGDWPTAVLLLANLRTRGGNAMSGC